MFRSRALLKMSEFPVPCSLPPDKVKDNNMFCIAAYMYLVPDSRKIRLQNVMIYLTKIYCFNFSVAILFSLLKLESLSVNLRSLFKMSAAFSSALLHLSLGLRM